MSGTTPQPCRTGERFGDLLRTRRLHAGLSQEGLAGRSGLSPRAIRKIEAGQSTPRATTLDLIADALGLSGEDRTAFFTTALAGDRASGDTTTEPVPTQLPAVTSLFHGRRTELKQLMELARPGRVVTVSGMAGVGKSSLTLHAARTLATDHPDGQLFLDLYGFSASRPPVDPADALDRLLRTLGVPGGRIPSHSDDRSALLRSTLSERRILLVLDNAVDAEQLRPLLPGDSPTTVLVTSRNTLTGIHDAGHLQLEPLDTDAAVSLLAEATGNPEPQASDHQAMIGIAELCGQLPLAIRIAAAKLVSRPRWSAADLLQRMRQQPYVLTGMGTGPNSVQAAFDATYRGLPKDRQRLFRLLGTIPVSGFDVFTAAALVHAVPAEVEAELESLVDAHLLETGEPGRYHFHDLLRDFAAHTARHNDDQPARTAALGRVMDMFRESATTAIRQLAPNHLDLAPDPPNSASVATPAITDQRAAVAWFTAEFRTALALVAAAEAQGMDRAAVDLAAMIQPFLLYHAHNDELLRLAQRGVVMAQRLDDRRTEAHWLLAEGGALHRCGREQEAKASSLRALRLYEEFGDLARQAAVLSTVGMSDHFSGGYESALSFYDRAIQLARQAGDETREGIVHSNLANSMYLLGRFDEAIPHLHNAMEVFQRRGHERELARTRLILGNVLRAQGRAGEALELHRLVAEYTGRNRELEGLGFANNAMAHDCVELGRIAEARTYGERAWETAERNRFESLLHELSRTWGSIHLAAGALDAAETAFTRYLSHAENTGNRHDRALGLHGIADVSAARGDETEAVRLYTEAADLYEALGIAEAETLRRRLS